MMRKKKTFQAIFFSLLSIFIFYLSLSITLNTFLPKLTSKINKIQKILISYDKVDLELFPCPGLKISNLRIKKEKTIELKFKRTNIFVNFVGIPSNKFLGIKATFGTIFLYNLNFTQKKQNKPFSIPKIPVEFIELSNIYASTKLNGMNLNLNKAYAFISLKRDKINLKCRGRSNLTKNFNIEGELTKDQKTISAKLMELNLNNLLKTLPKNYSYFKDISGLINTDIKLEIKDKRISAKINTTSRELHLGNKIEKLELKLAALIDNKTHLSKIIVKNFYTKYPYINISGKIERSLNKTNVQLTGQKINISNLIEFYKKFPFKNHILDTVFAIVRGGILYNSSFDLEKINHKSTWSLGGECTDTNILIPHIKLPLKKLSGKINIKNNILMCREIKGFYRNSKIQNGYLDLGLNKYLSPFVINTHIYFNIKDLKPLLNILHVSDKITNEIEKININSGNCTGIFTLNKKSEKYIWKVIARKIQLNAGLQNTPIKLNADVFSITNGSIYVKNANINLKRSKLKNIVLNTDFNSNDIKLLSYNSKIDIKEIKNVFNYFISLNDKLNIIGSLFLNKLKVHYNYHQKKLEDYLFLGSISYLRIKGLNLKNKLPKKINVSVSRGNFSILPQNLKFTSFTINTLKSKIKLNYLKLMGNVESPKSVKMEFSGDISKEAQEILKKINPYIKFIKTNKSLHLRQMKFNMTSQDIKVNGDMILNGIFTNLQVEKNPHKFSSEISLSYNATKCSIQFNKQKEKIFINFRGKLTHNAVDRLLVKNPYLKDKIAGNFSLNFSLNPFYIINSNGFININDMIINPDLGLSINQLSANSTNNVILIKKSLISLFKDKINLYGKIHLIKGRNNINIRLESHTLHLDPLINKFSKKQPTNSNVKLTGTVYFNIKNTFYKKGVIRDIDGKILINNGFKELRIYKGFLCALPIKAVLKKDKKTKKLDIKINSLNFLIQDTLQCLVSGQKKLITGTSKIKITLHANLNDNPIKTLNGDFFFESKEGKIFKLTLISQILSIINSTEIFFGKIPDLGKVGFKYTDLQATGTIKDGCLIFRKSYLNATNMELAFHGKINLNTKEVNLIVLFAPLKTIDRFVKKIPILRYITGGNLLVIPFQAKGTIDNPIIIPLSPKAVGSEALKILKNTIKLPFTIFQPIRPHKINGK